MKNLRIVCFMFMILRIRPLYSTGICDLEIKQCAARGGDNIHKNSIYKLDPLSIKDPIVGHTVNFDYKMKNTKISSLKTCKSQWKFNKNLHTFINILRCSKLDIRALVTLNGLYLIDETDSVSITLNNYIITISGGYKTVMDSNQSTRMSLTDFSIKTKLEGPAIITANKMFGVTTLEAYLADEYIKQNVAHMEKDLHPVIKALVKKIVDRADKFLKVTPMNKVFPKI